MAKRKWKRLPRSLEKIQASIRAAVALGPVWKPSDMPLSVSEKPSIRKEIRLRNLLQGERFRIARGNHLVPVEAALAAAGSQDSIYAVIRQSPSHRQVRVRRTDMVGVVLWLSTELEVTRVTDHRTPLSSHPMRRLRVPRKD